MCNMPCIGTEYKGNLIKNLSDKPNPVGKRKPLS